MIEIEMTRKKIEIGLTCKWENHELAILPNMSKIFFRLLFVALLKHPCD